MDHSFREAWFVAARLASHLMAGRTIIARAPRGTMVTTLVTVPSHPIRTSGRVAISPEREEDPLPVRALFALARNDWCAPRNGCRESPIS